MQENAEQTRIILELLNSVERNGSESQRSRASDFGIAVGLVNAYIKYCVKKGYVKVKHYPARRYSYLLTPKGFAEKSKLTMAHLSNSLAFFRQARTDCAEIFAEAERRGWKSVVLVGATEVAEISMLCAIEKSITIAAIVTPEQKGETFVGFPLFNSLEEIPFAFDGVIVTDIKRAAEASREAYAKFGKERVLIPSLLNIARSTAGAAKR